jgi:hypothetical protein
MRTMRRRLSRRVIRVHAQHTVTEQLLMLWLDEQDQEEDF